MFFFRVITHACTPKQYSLLLLHFEFVIILYIFCNLLFWLHICGSYELTGWYKCILFHCDIVFHEHGTIYVSILLSTHIWPVFYFVFFYYNTIMKILISISQCTCLSVSLQHIPRSVTLSSKVRTGSTS